MFSGKSAISLPGVSRANNDHSHALAVIISEIQLFPQHFVNILNKCILLFNTWYISSIAVYSTRNILTMNNLFVRYK